MHERLERWRSPSVIGAACAIGLALILEVAFSNPSGTSPDFVLFLGRFHPLVVHLPIGIYLLVAAGELATLFPRLRPRIDPAIGLILPALVVSALGALLLGHLLAREGGFPVETLLRHRRLVLLASLGACLCLGAWAFHEQPRGRLAYRALLGLSLGLLSIGAHYGGTLSRGEAYLAKYAPEPLKPLLGGGEASRAEAAKPVQPKQVAEPLLFAAVVQPVLQEYCVECHGPEKAKGKLRLDALEHIAKGGESGAAIVPGSAERSLLVQRMELAPGHEDRMPPEGKPEPRPEHLALIRFWIDRGASNAFKVRDALAPANARSLLEQTLGGAEPIAGAAPRTREPSAASEPAPAGVSANDASPDEPKAGPAQGAAEPAPAPPAALAKRLEPFAILADKCEKCHGPEKAKGKLRVDSRAALLRGGSSGPAIVEGNPEQSELLRRVRLPLDHDEHMPPKKEPQLTPEEARILHAWIRSMGTASRAAAGGDTAPAAESEAPAVVATGAETAVGESAGAARETGAAEPAPEQAKVALRSTPAPASLSGRVALFADVIKPLLVEKCGKCHAGESPIARLAVNDHARLLAGGSSGPAVVAGNPDQSLLYQRMIVPLSDSDHMPPEGEPQMTSDEIATVRFWIEKGAHSDAMAAGAELPREVERTAAERAPARDASDAEIKARPGGCGACGAVGGSAPALGGLSSLALVLVLGLRRSAASRGKRRQLRRSVRGPA